MATKKQPSSPHNSTIGVKPRKTVTKHGGLTKKQIEHEYKLSLMRECQIYSKPYLVCKLYFESKGFSLGETQFTDLRNELKSTKQAKEWFSKEALYVLEDDHKLSVQRIRVIEDEIMKEFEQVISTNFYRYIDSDNPDLGFVKDKNHDYNALVRLSGEFRAIQEIKSKMFSATPLVQELMEVHRRQEEEHSVPPPHPKVKEITHV